MWNRNPKRCVFGCYTEGLTIHDFPNPKRFPHQFQTWVDIVGESLANLTKGDIYRKKKVCHVHFTERDWNRNNRLNALAVPSLHIPENNYEQPTMKSHSDHNYCDGETPLSKIVGSLDVRGGHGHCSSTTPLLDKKASGTVDLNIENLNSVDTELNSAVSHDVDIDSDLEVPQIIETESDSEVPDTSGPFTWQKHSEIIVSDDEDDKLHKRIETETDNVLYEDNKNVTKHSSECNIRREGELELQSDGNQEDDQLHSQPYKCNICSSIINGFRYRCVQCVDYDLCAACEARGAHEFHYVLRIPGPRPYAEIEKVLNRIRKELADMNNTVLFEYTDMIDSLKEEVKDEIEDPLHENQTTENSDHNMAANDLDERSDDPLESDTDVQSMAEEEDRRQKNDNIEHENNNMIQDNDNKTRANDVTHEVGKEDKTCRSVLTKPHLKVVVMSSLKRKINESPTKLPNMNINSIQQPLDSKKLRSFPASVIKLDNNVSSIQPHLDSNKITLLPVSTKQLPDNISSFQQPLDSKKIRTFPASVKKLAINVSSIQPHLVSKKIRLLPASTKQLPDNISSIQQPLDSRKIRTFPASAKKFAINVSSIQPHLDSKKIKLLPASTKQLPDNISSIQPHLDSKKIRLLPASTKQLPDNFSSIQLHLDSKKIRLLPTSTKQLPDNISSIQPHLDSKKIRLLPASTKQLPDNISSIQQHRDSNKTGTLPASTEHLPEHFRTRPIKSVVTLKMPQKSLASNPSDITNNLSTPLFIRQPLNVITETNQHLLAEQLFGDKVPQVHLKPLTTEEMDGARDSSLN